MKYNKTTFPIQKCSMSKKNEEWQQASIDYIIGMGEVVSGGMTRSRFEELLTYYNLYNSIFDEKDLKSVTNPFKVDDGFPATPKDYNIIRPKVDLLIGEETKRPFNFRISRTSQEAASEMQEKTKGLLMNYIMASITARMSEEEAIAFQQGLDSGEIMPPLLIAKYMQRDYKDIIEGVAYHSLNYLRQKNNTDHEFVRGWKDALIAGEEVYHVGVLNGEPVMERVNPLYFSFDKSPDLEFIEDGDWCCRRMRLSYTEVYDRFYDKMEEKDLNELLDIIDLKPTAHRADKNMIDDFNHIRMRTIDNPSLGVTSNNSVNVWHTCWKSFKKIAYVTYQDETGELQQTIVDENYTENGTEFDIYWDWIVEVWEGYRIGHDLYIGCAPLEYQHVSIDNPNSQKLPYCGVVYSNTNSAPKSLVSIMKPLQYMYIILWYRLELALARDKGKVITMDITQIPKSMNIDPAKWMHYLSAVGVNFVNPYEEGWDIPGREGGKCHIKGTNVLMADGTIRKVEDIRLFDQIMGPDNAPRTVLELHNGTDDMYSIIPSSGGNTQIVNSAHEVYYGKYNKHTGNTTFETATPTELMLRFRNTPSCRDKHFLHRTNGIEFEKQDLPLDPYLLGLWLGDGTTNKPAITTCDMEIINYLNDYAYLHDMQLNIFPIPNNNAVTAYLAHTIKSKRGYRNKFTNDITTQLRNLNILSNKDIPYEYIYTSREDRLQLLAGLIDSDGWYDEKKNRFGFCLVDYRKHIVDKFVFIARSLGMKVSVRYKKSTPSEVCKNTSEGSYIASILSDCKDIPTKVKRKLASRDKFWAKDTLRSMFTVEYYGKAEYYGFTVDKDSLFLLDDFTICHNSSAFNQISALDLTMANVVDQYINLMYKIELIAGELSGITQLRLGSISSNELVGNVERSVVQSSHITEPLFWMHNQCKRRVLNMLLNTAKGAWLNSGKKKLHYIFDDAQRAFLDIEDSFYYEDMDIFVTDTTRDLLNMEALKSLILPAMLNGASLLDAAEVLTADNISVIKNRLKDIEQQNLERSQQAQQAEQEAQQELIRMLNEAKAEDNAIREEELALKKYEIDQNNFTKLAVALVTAYRGTEDMDQDDNGVVDVMEIGKQAIEQQKIYDAKYTKEREISAKKSIETNKIALEEKKIKAAEKLLTMKDTAAMEREKLKSVTALKNKVSGLKSSQK